MSISGDLDSVNAFCATTVLVVPGRVRWDGGDDFLFERVV
jgi:hypothetical protein